MKTDKMTIAVADILDGAATYIERHGWTKCDFFARPEGENPPMFPPACALGAIGISALGRQITDQWELVDGDEMWAAVISLLEHLADVNIGQVGDIESLEYEDVIAEITQWNDDRFATAEMVVVELRAVAACYRAEHAKNQEA